MATQLETLKAALVAKYGYGGGGFPVMPEIGELVDLIVASIQAGELAALSVSTAELADGAVTAIKVTDGTLTAAKFAQGAAVAAALAAGLGASVNIDHADSSPVTLIAADGAKDRAVLVMAIITETLAGGTTKPSFSLGWAGTLEGVVVSREYKFLCSSLGQAMIADDIRGEQLTRVVVAACSPHLHEKTFRRACANAGLNPFLLQMANIREHVSWVT